METKKRKVVQIVAAFDNECDREILYALADDGTMWRRLDWREWEEIKNIPQD